jgi:hypothetical protein
VKPVQRQLQYRGVPVHTEHHHASVVGHTIQAVAQRGRAARGLERHRDVRGPQRLGQRPARRIGDAIGAGREGACAPPGVRLGHDDLARPSLAGQLGDQQAIAARAGDQHRAARGNGAPAHRVHAAAHRLQQAAAVSVQAGGQRHEQTGGRGDHLTEAAERVEAGHQVALGQAGHTRPGRGDEAAVLVAEPGGRIQLVVVAVGEVHLGQADAARQHADLGLARARRDEREVAYPEPAGRPLGGPERSFRGAPVRLVPVRGQLAV